MTIRTPSASVTKDNAMAQIGSAFHDHSFWYDAARPISMRNTRLTTEATKPCQIRDLRNLRAHTKRNTACMKNHANPYHARTSRIFSAVLSMSSWSLYHTPQNLILRNALNKRPALL